MNISRIIRWALLSMLATCNTLFSQSLVAEEAEYRADIDNFFQLVAKGKPEEAIDRLYGTTPYATGLTAQLDQLKRQFVSYADAFGTYHTYEVVVEKTLVDRYVYLWVMGIYERQPVFFDFAFYKPHRTWQIQTFTFGAGEEMEGEIARQAKSLLWPRQVLAVKSN